MTSADCLRLEVPAEAASVGRVRRAVTDFGRDAAMDPHAVALAVSEAVTNAVVHGYRAGDPGTVRIEARVEDGDLVVTVHDDGIGMAPRLDSPGMGLGLPTMATLTASFDVDSADGGTRVCMRFHPVA